MEEDSMGRKMLRTDTYYAQNKERVLAYAKDYYRVRKFLERLELRFSALPRIYQLFWAQVDRGDVKSCWRWLGPLSEKGYGITETCGITERAHRVAWELSRGTTAPQGKVVIHKCDTPACCNPLHLRLATHADNVADCIAKARRADFSGENSPRAKLSDDQIAWLRDEYAARGGTWLVCKQLADELGVTPGHVNNVIRGRYR
jgi:hypothetical protein